MRKYQVVMVNESFNDSYYFNAVQKQTDTMFDSLEDAKNSGNWFVSGALYIVSFNPKVVFDAHPGDFKIEVSR